MLYAVVNVLVLIPEVEGIPPGADQTQFPPPPLLQLTGSPGATGLEQVGGGAVSTLTVELPDWVASWVEVAVMVAVPALAGAVKRPDALIVPLVVPQMTEVA